MKKLLLIITAIISISISADAKWWIFGKSNDEVGLKYLYINKISADETGPKIKVFKETLGTDGLIRITGKASVGKSAVGSVRISLDDKTTWTDLKFADNGTFEYSFKPEQEKTYAMLLEVTDTAGKTNKVDETRKEISLSDENIQAKVRETLDAMFAAYNAENLQKFLGYVGENFAGDKAILERAVKRDFDALSSINLRYTMNSVAAGAQGRMFVSVTFNRMVFVNKTGASATDSGSTEFVFDSNEGKLSLFSMKQPLMFGLSDAENVATGEVIGNTGANLALDDTGNLGGGMQTVNITCSGVMPTMHGIYYFSTGKTGCHPQDDITLYGQMADMLIYSANIEPHNGLQAKTFAGKNLPALTSSEVKNLSGYAATKPYPVSSGNSYGIYIGGEFYGVEFTALPAASGAQDMSFRIKKF